MSSTLKPSPEFAAFATLAALITTLAPPAWATEPTPPPPRNEAPVAPARPGRQAIQGVIHDALGRPLADVQVRLRTAAGQGIAEARSDAKGAFEFHDLGAGTYAVVAEKPGFATGTAIVPLPEGSGTPAVTTELTLAAQAALEVTVAAERLNQARSGLSPKTGGSVFRFSQEDLATLPEGRSTAFNQVMLQAPGVANDSYGELHVRGDHGNLQYRINGVILPEGISGFGQSLDTRFARRIDLMTGALPAQYGYRTAGVIEIETNNQIANGGRLDLSVGSHGSVQSGLEYGGSQDRFSYYLSGSFLTNTLGVENPTGASSALHDRTTQEKGFAYLSYLLDDTTRLSAMVGSYTGRFQIPNNPGQTADPDGKGFLAGAGLTAFDSASLNEHQREVNHYGILALQGTAGSALDYQVALFSRYTSVHYQPDPLGDLVFNGVAADVFRSSQSTGVQGDAAYRINDRHTLRAGGFFSSENVVSNNSATVFPTDDGGNVSGPATTIVDNNRRNGNQLLGLYLQDEWKVTDRLTVNYGARADHLSAYVTASQLSPRLGLVFQATPATTLHAGYARYFTPPPTELISPKTLALFAGTSNAPEVTQNSAVQPERSHYLDAGITHRFSDSFSMGFDAYYKKVTNLLDEGQFGQALIFAPFNYAQGKIFGAELSANYRAGNLSAYGNLARTVSLAKQINSAQFNFGQDELDYIANNWVHTDHDQAFTGSAGVAYRLGETRYSSDLIFGSGLRRGFANSEHLPAYTQVNVGASRQFVTPDLGKVEARVAVINLFDKVYELRDGSGIGVGAPQYGPRRGLYLGLSKYF